MGRTIDDIIVSDVEKRKIPSKHYVYVIYVTWSDGSTNIIYRRYSRLFDFQSKLREMYPEEAGSVDPEKRIIPFLPGKKFFGRSHIREVAVKRLGPIADYCKQIVKLPRKLSQCKEVLEFFEMDMDDMNPQKGKKASMKAHKISTPKPLEIYIACTAYKKQEKGEVSLKIGMMVEVVEKTETGWWFVNADEEQGWVPSTCLEREDGEKEETTTRFRPGEEEQYLSTEEFKGEGPDELSMERGAVVDVIEKNLEGWWRVRYNGKEGYVPATYLMKTEAFQVSKRNEQGRTSGEGPQIVRSLHEVSNLLKDGQLQPVEFDDEFDDTYAEPEEEPIYTIHEISRILKENKKGDKETERINENIRNMKSRSLKRGGSMRPPPRPDNKPQFGEKKAVVKPVLNRIDSLSVDYITIAEFSDVVGDGISFSSGQHVRVLEKSEEGWWFIQIGDSEGWAPATYIEKANPAPVPSPTSSAPPPPPPQQSKKSKPTPGNQEDVSNESNGSPRRLSAVEGLKDAFKAKLNKGKGPPVPPKKDFLDSDDDQTEEADTSVPSVPAATSKPALGKPGFQLPVKPGQTKSPNRTMLKSPPPPPSPVAKANTSDTNTAAASRPAPPFKVKPNLGNKPTPPAKAVSNSDDSEESSGKINVAGLAGALKARFESKESDKPTPAPPQANLKRKLEQKPKPTPPSMTQKPTPPSLTQKPVIDRDSKQGLKPVLNKVEFPGANKGGPVIPGKPSGNKPNITSSTKPSWVKPDSDNTNNRPSWAKHQDDSESKPSWAKKDSSNITRPTSHDTDNTSKPAWAKPKVNNASKPAWAKPDNDTNTKPAWAKPDNETNTKPAWAKPDINKSAKPSWAKQDNESKTDSPSVGAGGGKVSDLASVLKSKFENKQKEDSDSGPAVSVNKRPGPPALPDTGNKPFTSLKPKPPRPASPRSVSPTPGALSPRAGKKGLDPKKYSSRPLPPKPAKGAPQVEEVDDNPVRNKPLPGLPKKPAGGVTNTTTGRKDSSDSDDDVRPRGVSGLANALKAKLGANRPDSNSSPSNSHSNKPLPGVPVKSKTESTTPNITDKQNNNNTVPSDCLLNAIADYDAGSDGEMSLVIGQQYELLDKAEGWWYVRSGSHEGWAPADYLEHVRDSNQSSTPKTVQNAGRPKRSVFRTCSDFTAENEGELSVPGGQEVTVLDSPEGGWWLVKYGSNEGWMPESYVEEIMV